MYVFIAKWYRAYIGGIFREKFFIFNISLLLSPITINNQRHVNNLYCYGKFEVANNLYLRASYTTSARWKRENHQFTWKITYKPLGHFISLLYVYVYGHLNDHTLFRWGKLMYMEENTQFIFFQAFHFVILWKLNLS